MKGMFGPKDIPWNARLAFLFYVIVFPSFAGRTMLSYIFSGFPADVPILSVPLARLFDAALGMVLYYLIFTLIKRFLPKIENEHLTKPVSFIVLIVGSVGLAVMLFYRLGLF